MPARNRLAATASCYAWEMEELATLGAAPAGTRPLVVPAILITGDAAYRLRRCANDACLWLFLDESKNATRRWCDMASCGNRAKARRHYLKVKARQA